MAGKIDPELAEILAWGKATAIGKGGWLLRAEHVVFGALWTGPGRDFRCRFRRKRRGPTRKALRDVLSWI